VTAGGCCPRHIRHVSLVVAALWLVVLTANLPVIFSYRIKTYVTSLLNASDAEPYKYCDQYKYKYSAVGLTVQVRIQYVCHGADGEGFFISLIGHRRRTDRRPDDKGFLSNRTSTSVSIQRGK